MTNLVIGSSSGKGGNRGGTPSEAKDNLDSKQFARVLDLIGEGEMGGLINGAQSIFIDNIPLQNADGSYNFRDVSWASRFGTSSQEVIPLTENTSTANTTTFSGNIIQLGAPRSVTITNTNIDAVKVTIAVDQLQEITDKGDIEGSEFELEISVTYGSGSAQIVVDSTNGKIKGRTGDLYQREYLINLNWPSGVTSAMLTVSRKTTAVGTLPKVANGFRWTTYTEITYDSLTYPNSMLVGLKVDAEQFTSVPQRKYLVQGIKVKVPNNATVNADGSLSYSGNFLGSLGAAVVTNDPAWILYDLLTSNRYGLGDYLNTSDLDIYSFYACSQYCSARIYYSLDGVTIQEPRFTCNVNIQTAQEAYTLINQLCSVFRAQAYWSAGNVSLTQDSPGDTKYLFSIANVLEPGFTYQTSSQKNRATVAVVKYFDNDLRDFSYEEVKDNTNIAKYGSIVKNVDAFACTSRGQANRLGKWLLYMENNERETCSFVTSIDAGVVCRPGQIIEIADEVKAGYRRSGRIKSATASNITVDDATGLTVSNSPTLSVILPNGSVDSKNINGISSGVVSVSSPFSAIPNANSIWVYQNSSIQTSTWRVVSVEEQDGINYGITAVSYNSSKYSNIESGIALTSRDITNLNVAPDAPNSINAEEIIYDNLGIARVKIILSWDNTTDNAYVRFRYNNNNWESRLVENSKTLEILDVVVGIYEIEVYSVNASGLRSVQSANQTVNAVGKTAVPSQVSGLNLIPINESSAILQWDRSTELDVILGGQVFIRRSNKTEGAKWGDAVSIFKPRLDSATNKKVEQGVPGSSTQYIVPLLTGTYLLKFVDDGGRISGSPGSTDSAWDSVRVAVNRPEPTDRLKVTTLDESIGPPGSLVIAGFQGTKVNTVWESHYNSGKDALLLTVANGATAASGTYTFYAPIDLGNVYSVNIQSILDTYSFGNETLWDDRTDWIDSWGDINDIGAVISDKCNATLFLRTTNDDPTSSPTWGAWQEFSNVLVTARGIDFYLEITSADTAQNIAVTDLGAILEVQSRTENITTPVTSGADIYKVSFSNAFYEPPAVYITPSESTAQEGDYFLVNNITRTGFEVTFKNTGSSAMLSRSFVWGATGYGKQAN
tara:strand:- start:6341 stop:9688 length:3348 start_codon:yes stop_codon:yes gene_type:complete